MKIEMKTLEQLKQERKDAFDTYCYVRHCGKHAGVTDEDLASTLELLRTTRQAVEEFGLYLPT